MVKIYDEIHTSLLVSSTFTSPMNHKTFIVHFMKHTVCLCYIFRSMDQKDFDREYATYTKTNMHQIH